MYIKSMIVLPFLIFLGCQNENTSLTNSNSPPDSIVSFNVLKDTTLSGVDLPFSDYPSVSKIGDSILQVEHLVQIPCGQTTFEVSKLKDTFFVFATIPQSYNCNDLVVEMYYKATIQYVGKSDYVKFTGGPWTYNGYGDTIVHL